MTFEDYEKSALRSYKPGQTDKGVPRMLGYTLGLAGESGETADMVKKEHFHDVPYERDKMLKELGDCLWYVMAVAHDHGWTLADVARENNRKLEARYPNGFVPGGGIR